MSSLGIYLTGGQTTDEHGRAMILRGMDASNSAAQPRGIILHAAPYVSDAFAKAHGRVGRSWGCPAVDYKYRNLIIDELQGGSVMLGYHSNLDR